MRTTIDALRSMADSVLPGALPATAGNVYLALLTTAPTWLVALGQALIVALWCSNAVKRQNREISARLQTVEDAVCTLECVRAKRVAALTGTPIAPCSTPPPMPTR